MRQSLHTGTYVIAVTGNFGFLAQVLARKSSAVLEAITSTRRWLESTG